MVQPRVGGHRVDEPSWPDRNSVEYPISSKGMSNVQGGCGGATFNIERPTSNLQSAEMTRHLDIGHSLTDIGYSTALRSGAPYFLLTTMPQMAS